MIIGVSAFDYCKNLADIQIPQSIRKICESAFDSAGLLSISLPYGFLEIESYVFDGCSKMHTLIVPESVTYIGRRAFGECNSLKTFVIPPKVTSIDINLFYNCYSMTSITISEGVNTIKSDAFYNCTSLTTVRYLGTNSPKYSGSIFADTKVTKVQVTSNYLNTTFCNYPITVVSLSKKLDDDEQ